MKKKLFTLSNLYTGESNKDFFENKSEAKKERNNRNKQLNKITWVVTRGPDNHNRWSNKQ